MRVLIDANIVLDVLLNRTPWVADSQAVCDANHQQQIQGHVVATAITNLFYIARIARKLVGRIVRNSSNRARLRRRNECTVLAIVYP